MSVQAANVSKEAEAIATAFINKVCVKAHFEMPFETHDDNLISLVVHGDKVILTDDVHMAMDTFYIPTSWNPSLMTDETVSLSDPDAVDKSVILWETWINKYLEDRRRELNRELEYVTALLETKETT
jgi:hypothetical protein